MYYLEIIYEQVFIITLWLNSKLPLSIIIMYKLDTWLWNLLTILQNKCCQL